MSPLFIILTCLFVWGIAWGVFGYFLLLRGVNYVSRYVTTTFYFLAIGAGMATVFWRTLEPFLCPVNQTSLLILISFMLAQFLLYIRLSRTTFANSEYLTLYPMREYLFFNPRRLLSK